MYNEAIFKIKDELYTSSQNLLRAKADKEETQAAVLKDGINAELMYKADQLEKQEANYQGKVEAYRRCMKHLGVSDEDINLAEKLPM